MKDDAIAELAARSVGSMLCGPCPSTVEDEGASLFVREAGRAINTRDIEVRVGLLVSRDASPGVVMLSGYRHYAAWLNWHEPEDRELIQCMESQEWMPVFWYDENMEPERAVRVRNQWGRRLKAMMETWKQSEPWSADAFREAVAQSQRAHPRLDLLWSRLGTGSGVLHVDAQGPTAVEQGADDRTAPSQKSQAIPGLGRGARTTEGPSGERAASATAGDILVVDDDSLIQKIVFRWLSDQGYRCQVAGSGEEAWRLIQKREFALLVCDIMMPGMSGIELLTRVRRRFPDLAVIMATGVDDRETAVAAIEKGAYGYLIKPFGENELLIQTANALRRRELEMASQSYKRRLQQEVRRLTEEVRKREEGIITCVVSASEHGDESTSRHNRRIGLYTARLAKELSWDQPVVDEVRVAALMHDIGKTRVPDRILLKPGKLSPPEFEMVKTHTSIGASMLSHADIALLRTAKDIALSHHEKWDGSGYPKGLAGEAIPACARLVAVADVYDALVTPRVYKPPVSHREAIDVMAKGSRKHFDPKAFNCFLRVSSEFQHIRDEVGDGSRV